MSDSVQVAIIGGGQAGLATSWHLTDAEVDHLVLEAGRVGETWRGRRWDSFCLVTPNWSVQLPGAKYSGPDPDGFMPLIELIEYLDAWAASFRAPVLEHTPVLRLEADSDGGFVVSMPDEKLRARNVVVATGAFQRAFRPAGAEALPKTLMQIFAEEYRNPDSLPPGAVLIVGSGQTGCQLAEELHQAGRKVFLACGRCLWAPRRFDGRDLVWWLAETGFLDRTPDKLPSPAARLLGNPQATGHGGGHDLHFRTLEADGVELLGRFVGADGTTIHLADDLAASVDFGDARLDDLMKFMEAGCAQKGIPPPSFEQPPPLKITTRTELDVVQDGIGTVIWTSGYRPDYGWVKFPVFDDMGFPIQTDGLSPVPGLYFMGVHWLRKNKSSILYGAGEDAQVVAQHIVQSRR
ncbi:MAG TPA: NAD(P)-binding domain-containing protein [Candidatus Dormibacteraeota bacterium]|nr:NAD(P)-binding domain-containing protein [Candidatus Dormibacteraeota bacterium]